MTKELYDLEDAVADTKQLHQRVVKSWRLIKVWAPLFVAGVISGIGVCMFVSGKLGALVIIVFSVMLLVTLF